MEEGRKDNREKKADYKNITYMETAGDFNKLNRNEKSHIIEQMKYLISEK